MIGKVGFAICYSRRLIIIPKFKDSDLIQVNPFRFILNIQLLFITSNILKWPRTFNLNLATLFRWRKLSQCFSSTTKSLIFISNSLRFILWQSAFRFCALEIWTWWVYPNPERQICFLNPTPWPTFERVNNFLPKNNSAGVYPVKSCTYSRTKNMSKVLQKRSHYVWCKTI